MAEEIKAGDVVQLKSGGPRMTVSQTGATQLSKEQHAWCDWFVQEKAPWKKDSGVFPFTSLKVLKNSTNG
jgi:uncharacterized protein YodC (DUF2158 family)